MTVAQEGLERGFVGFRFDQKETRRSLVALDHRALDLDLVIGPETEPYGFVLACRGHLAAADKHAVAIDRDPARQQWRVLVLLETCFEKHRRIQDRRGADDGVGGNG